MNNKVIIPKLLAFCILLLFASCRKKAWDEFYDRPNTLADPIYKQLAGKGNFKNLLALIDKGGYKQVLVAGGGYWTMFAPNDEAFDKYFKDKGIADVNAIDSATARAMVQYFLVYNSFEKDRLDDYQATANNQGWTPSVAFRRTTAYYTGFYKDTGLNNKPITAIAANRNNITGSLTGNYITGDDNNKYITYFTDDYFQSAGLSASDYNYFYPSSTYTGFNVAEAKVVTKDIPAENGVIHEIDRVINPLQSIDEYIRTKPEYSSFRALLNRMYVNNTVQFIYNSDASHRYQVLTGKNDSVFVKAYSPLLSFSPNNENFLKAEDNDGQKDCWTMFIPNNTAVDNYVKNVLCEYYPSLDQMPMDIIADFLNAHMFATAVWPSKFAVTRNKFAEPARFNPNTDVFDRKILSNGIVYGTTKVEEADVFSTVYSKAYLNPGYSMMTRLLNLSGLKLLIANSSVPVNIFLIPDKAFAAAGYSYNVSKDQYEYTPAGGSASTNGVKDKLTRIANTCVFFEPYKSDVQDLSGADIVKSGASGTEGDFIKFNNNTILTGGLLDAGKTAVVDSVKTASNGKVYFINDLLTYSEKPVGTHVKNLGTATTSEFNYFWQYLSNSVAMYNAATTDINGLTGFNTVFVPNNAAILQAVNDGVLPGTGTAPNKVPTFNPTNDTGRELVRKFLQYHILYGHTVVPDGNLSGRFDTYLKDSVGNSIKINITNSKGAMIIRDNQSIPKPSELIMAQSNNLSNRCVIHLLNDYLKYN
ncbi:fasciclin domain-containing protein [Niastella sp. OAS944]|uniref:fasciclin domain-containing protein n=1 Tax=Niastella sp. OAS944 TaxID=2664089 RepID=UPI0034891E5C|nr:putative surface protein with fasciclin (FAS1) repeats [Chitinophagaceae bacterium OAS944]